MIRAKVALLGDSKVGKSALAQIFHGKPYPKNYILTLGVDFLVKAVRIPDTESKVELYVMDTSGSDIYKHVRHLYWENASLVMLVYDMTSKKSFQSCARWLEEFKKATSAQKVQGVLVGAKSDMKDYAEVTQAEAHEFAAEHDIAFFEVCAATTKDVDVPFNFLAHAVFTKYEASVKAFGEL